MHLREKEQGLGLTSLATAPEDALYRLDLVRVGVGGRSGSWLGWYLGAG